MKKEDYNEYYIQNSNHYLIPKDVFIELFEELENWKEESKILRENAENNDKVVDNVNWENMLLKKENKQLKDNWNKLRKYISSEWYCFDNESMEFEVAKSILNKMQELEQGSDSNESK